MDRKKKIMGLDYGERRIGVALSDSSRIIATGHSTIDTRKDSAPLDTICAIIDEEDIGTLVVGLPERTDGKAGGKADDVKKWVEKLQKRISIPVYYQDESYTSSMARESLTKRKGRKRKRVRKESIDRVAACFILQEFMNNFSEENLS